MAVTISGSTGFAGVDGSAGTPAVQGADSNTGVFFPAADTVAIATGGTERVRTDSSGNVGIGVTPSAWISTSGRRAIEIGTAGNSLFGNGASDFLMLSNAYRNASSQYIYSNNGLAAQYQQADGTHRWYNAPSGTAGNAITFTQAMTLDSVAQLTVGVANDTTAQQSGRVNLYGAQSSGYGSCIFGYNNSTVSWFVGSYSQIAGGTQYTSLGLRAGTTGGQYMTAGGTTWNAVSDETRKDILEPITDGAKKVASLRAVIGKYKTDEDGVRRSFLIAQDVQKVLPEAVNITEDKEGEVLGLAYTDVIPLLVAAIKEQQALIESLTARITALEGAAS